MHCFAVRLFSEMKLNCEHDKEWIQKKSHLCCKKKRIISEQHGSSEICDFFTLIHHRTMLDCTGLIS